MDPSPQELRSPTDSPHNGAIPAIDIFPAVYEELRSLADRLLREERINHTLQPTALVNEAYMKLCSGAEANARNRTQFFSMAARAMRQILVDHARARLADRRGGGWHRITLDHVGAESSGAPVDFLALEEALDQLSKLDPRKARLVELRFFAGLTIEEAAETLDIARSTAADDWAFARAWLSARLREEEA